MTRGKKAVAAFLAELVFAGLVALAFVRLGTLPGDTLSQSPGARLIPRLPDPVFYLLLAVLAALLLTGLILTVLAFLREKRGPAPSKDVDPLRASYVLAVVILGFAISLVIGGAILALLIAPPERDAVQAAIQERLKESKEEPDSPEQPEPEPTTGGIVPGSGAAGRYILIGSLVVALALSVALTVRLLRSRLAPAAEGEDALARLRSDLKSAAEEGIEAVLREDDPRKAVVACYARMEQVLRAHGYPRAQHLTPMEYMTATLGAIAAAGAGLAGAAAERASASSDAVREASSALLGLTELYELARFSEHTIYPRDKDAAVSCLEKIRGSLVHREATA